MRETIFTIDSAIVSFYPIQEGSSTRTDPFGTADTDHPIFSNREAESIRLISRLEERVIRPTGYRYPIHKHVGEEHEISIDRVYVQRIGQGAETPAESSGERRNKLYILQVIWLEPSLNPFSQPGWQSRTYHGVTLPNWDLRTDVDVIAFTESQTLKAAFYKTGAGVGDPPQTP